MLPGHRLLSGGPLLEEKVPTGKTDQLLGLPPQWQGLPGSFVLGPPGPPESVSTFLVPNWYAALRAICLTASGLPGLSPIKKKKAVESCLDASDWLVLKTGCSTRWTFPPNQFFDHQYSF